MSNAPTPRGLWQRLPERRLLVAVACSLALHALLVFKERPSAPARRTTQGADTPLTVRTIPADEPPAPAPALETPPPTATQPGPQEQAAAPATPQLALHSATAAASADPAFLSAVTPASLANIEYAVTRSDRRGQLEVRRMHFESDNPGHYRLSDGLSESSPTKLLPGAQRYLEVTGKLTSNGLVPEELYEQGTGSDAQERHVTLTEGGAIDRISLYYQFMFAPPRVGDAPRQVLLAEGGRTQAHSYEVVGQELLATANLGTQPAIHIRLTPNGSKGSTDLWLSPALRYLPIRMRQTDAAGVTVEQEATTLLVR